MPSSPTDENTLLIRCPGCGQRFKVQQDLRERMVECGVCEHRFHIRDSVIVRLRKFYPGESRRHGLNRFQRIPHAAPVSQPLGAAEMYEPAPPPSHYEPVPPQRILAGFIGVLAMLLIAMLLIFGGGHGGPLDGVAQGRRLIMAGFTALIGFTLLMYANPRTRGVAALVGVVFTAALLVLPFAFIDGSQPLSERVGAGTTGVPEESAADQEPNTDQELTPVERFRERMGLRPLEQEIERLAAADSPFKAYGLALSGLQESNRIAVRDYMFRVTSADPSSHIYPRDENTYLFVITGLDVNIESLAALAAPLGQVRAIFPEINVVDIIIDNNVFLENTSDKLVRRDDPEFYELNLRELHSIDLQRVQSAVLRLTDAEPRTFRSDITNRLRALLDESGVDFQSAIARALRVWDDDPDGAAEAATNTALRLHGRGEKLPVELVTLALEDPSESMISVLISQWRENILTWENVCIEMGPAIEPAMLREFETHEGSRRQSAVRILSRVGGEASRQALHDALDGANRELTVVINQALESIAARIGTE